VAVEAVFCAFIAFFNNAKADMLTPRFVRNLMSEYLARDGV